MKTLYAQVYKGLVELKEKELPAPGPGQLLLKAHYSTMSPGTENALMNGFIVPLPTSIGYSMCATVEAVGPGVDEFEVGDVVVTTGEHAQHLIMDAINCTPAPRSVDKKQAAFWNLGHTGMYAVRQSKLQFGEAAVVMGQGFVWAPSPPKWQGWLARCPSSSPICPMSGWTWPGRWASLAPSTPGKTRTGCKRPLTSCAAAASPSSLRPPAPASRWSRPLRSWASGAGW